MEVEQAQPLAPPKAVKRTDGGAPEAEHLEPGEGLEGLEFGRRAVVKVGRRQPQRAEAVKRREERQREGRDVRRECRRESRWRRRQAAGPDAQLLQRSERGDHLKVGHGGQVVEAEADELLEGGQRGEVGQLRAPLQLEIRHLGHRRHQLLQLVEFFVVANAKPLKRSADQG